MDYQIQKGDCLYSIAKSNYNCQTEKEIQDTVKQIATANDIKDPNLIQANANLVLPASATAKFKEQNKNDEFVSSTANNNGTDKIDNFDMWSTSSPIVNSIMKFFGLGDFKMFDFNAETYSSDLKEFSQEWIDKYDADKDGNWNYNEFVSMSTNGKQNVDDLDEATNKMFMEQFQTFSFDENSDSINAGEVASVLYSSDLDLDNYAKTGDVASSIDGKLDYNNFQTYPMLDTESDEYKTIHKERSDFYNNFYA